MPSSGVQTCALDRKSTRLNSSHGSSSYAVFCLKKKEERQKTERLRRMADLVTPPPHSLTLRFLPYPSELAPVRAALRRYVVVPFCFFFLMLRRPPGSTLFP